MKGTSKVMMGATLTMAIALAIVLSFILFLLAELYCSLLLSRRRKLQPSTISATSPDTSPRILPAPGVLLHAPRSFLYPSLETTNNIDIEIQSPSDTMEPKEHLVYICNPIYEGAVTPYETPESSPSHLGIYDDDQFSPELVPMKKLQPEACSVSLRDASSLATSPSASDMNSTESGSPSTSPSW